MIESVYDLLNDAELDLLDIFCANFKNEDTPRPTNYYNRMFLDKDKDLIDYQNKIKNYLFQKYGIHYEMDGIWINKITPDTNKNDGFHFDENALTVVSYINEDFEGGEFEYFLLGTKPNPKIKPKKNLSLITNDKLAHKVLPVISGERYSVVVFCVIPNKDKRTML
jgi:hypothetical protein